MITKWWKNECMTVLYALVCHMAAISLIPNTDNNNRSNEWLLNDERMNRWQCYIYIVTRMEDSVICVSLPYGGNIIDTQYR